MSTNQRPCAKSDARLMSAACALLGSNSCVAAHDPRSSPLAGLPVMAFCLLVYPVRACQRSRADTDMPLVSSRAYNQCVSCCTNQMQDGLITRASLMTLFRCCFSSPTGCHNHLCGELCKERVDQRMSTESGQVSSSRTSLISYASWNALGVSLG